MEEYLGKAFSQDYPISPERDAQLEREHKQWVRSLTKEKIAADSRMVLNRNGVGFLEPAPDVCRVEQDIVHKYALSLIGEETGTELWAIYQSVIAAYLDYINKGLPAKADFDPKKELLH